MKELHPDLPAAPARLPPDLPVALLTRHSLREEAHNAVPGYSVPLTPAGIELARAWGARLGRPLHRVLSSPVGRCVDTATAMMAGAGGQLPVQTDLRLVEPGCYVQDMRPVGRLFLELGPVQFANRHFSMPLPGVLSPQAGARRLLGLLQEHQGPPGSLSLFVTHDTILAAFIYTLAGRGGIDEADWPWMMEGAFLWFRDGRVHWLWRGREQARALADLDTAGDAA